MTTMVLNNTEFVIDAFARHTNIDDGGVYAFASVGFPTNNQYEALTQIGAISSLSIAIDGVVVYSLSNINAKITDISEHLDGHTVNMSAQISFNPENSELTE